MENELSTAKQTSKKIKLTLPGPLYQQLAVEAERMGMGIATYVRFLLCHRYQQLPREKLTFDEAVMEQASRRESSPMSKLPDLF